jgi:hypothetical protein
MPEPELHVRDLTPLLLTTVCESGRHIAHPGDTCEETDELRAVFRTWFETWMAEAYAHAEQVLLYGESFTAADQLSLVGNGMRGFLPLDDEPEPTPGERAFAILEPHLVGVTLYRPRHRWPVVG